MCQALLEKEEIKGDDKKTLSGFLSSFEFNYYILGKILADRILLEADLKNFEKRTSTANSTLKKFNSNIAKI